jgi:arylsulfatase A
MDFYPTFLEVAGLKLGKKPIDGESILPLLRQTGKLQREEIYFHFPNYAWHMDNRLGGAVRSDNWKLIRNYDDDSLELYDMSKDLSEKNNLVAKRPKIATRLNRGLTQWLKETNAPMPRPPKALPKK